MIATVKKFAELNQPKFGQVSYSSSNEELKDNGRKWRHRRSHSRKHERESRKFYVYDVAVGISQSH